MNRDAGLIVVLLDHFSQHLVPKALAIEKRLAAGERLTDLELAHLAEVLEQMQALKPLFERHPEHADVIAGAIGLYADIVRKAQRNESEISA